MNLADAVVLVTGSSSGIGAACARVLDARGARVIVHGRDPDRLDAAAADIGVKGIAVDLSRPGGVEQLAVAARDVHGRVDAVVHCAGLGWYGDTATMTCGLLDELVDVDLRAPLLLSCAVLPDMLARGTGHLAFVASIAGLTGVSGESVYAAAKSGLVTFADSLRLELAGTGVGVSVISPAAVRTDFFTRRGTPYARRFPRLIGPERIARAVAHAIEHDRAAETVPHWVAIAPVVRFAAPSLYRALCRRLG